MDDSTLPHAGGADSGIAMSPQSPPIAQAAIEKSKRTADEDYDGDDEGKKQNIAGDNYNGDVSSALVVSHVTDHVVKLDIDEESTDDGIALNPIIVAADQKVDSGAANVPGASDLPPLASFTAINAKATTNKQTNKQHRPKVRHGVETFEPHPTDANKLIARFKVQDPSGPDGIFLEQVDEIPTWNMSIKKPDNSHYYFEPSIPDSKVPSKNRPNARNNHQPSVFTKQADGSWTRLSGQGEPDDVWKPVYIFRRFDTVTHRYEEAYINLPRLENIDPNDKAWMLAYNKWIDQFFRRRDSNYTRSTIKDIFTTTERRVMMSAVNDFVREAGVHNFGFGTDASLATADLKKITEKVNAVGGMNRSVDAVKKQLSQSHPRKNKVVYELLLHAARVRIRLANKEEVPHGQVYPDNAIPEYQWPITTIQERKEFREQGLGKTESQPLVKTTQKTTRSIIANRKQQRTRRFGDLVFTVGILNDLLEFEMDKGQSKKRERDEEKPARSEPIWYTTDEEIGDDDVEGDAESEWGSTDEDVEMSEGEPEQGTSVSSLRPSTKRRRLG